MAEKRSDNVPIVQSVQRNKSNRDTSTDYRGSEWKDVAGVISQLKRGATQDRWMDFASHMLMTDGHLKTVHDTRINGVLRSSIVIEPASDSDLDKAAADFCRESYEATPRLEEFLYHAIFAESVGWTVSEAVYKRRGGMWHIEPVPVRPRDARVDPDWYYQVRTYQSADGVGYAEEWLDTKDRRDKWIIHAPTSGSDTVLTSGDLLACAPSWYFKKELEIGWLQGLERYANGLLIASHPSGARTETIAKIQDMLENLSFDHAASVEDTVTIQHIATSMDSGAYDAAVNHFEEVESKILLGSTLNTDAGANGSRLLGESQFATTTLPRLEVIASRLAETVKRDWFTPLLKFNAGAFGALPGTPTVRFQVIPEAAAQATVGLVSLAVASGAVKVSELRVLAGMSALDADEGGDDFIPALDAGGGEPAAFSEEVPGGTTPRPLSRAHPGRKNPTTAAVQLSLPMTTKRNTSAIGGHSPTKVARLQIDGLGSPPLLPSPER